MPFNNVQGGENSPITSDIPVNPLSRSDIPPEIRLLEKIDAFFCSAHKPEAQDCLRSIFYPPVGTFPNDVVNRFQQLRSLAYPGFRENIQAGRHGENHFCIMDENSQEILTSTIDDASGYTVACEGYRVSCSLRVPPHTAEEYKAIWSEWVENSTTGDHTNRLDIADYMYRNMTDNTTKLTLSSHNVEILPAYLPPSTECLSVDMMQLIRLPPLPASLTELNIMDTPLTSLPELPASLTELVIIDTPLTNLPELPASLTELIIIGTSLTSLPELPNSLTKLHIIDTSLTSLPELPASLTELYITNVDLTSLPELPASLTELHIIDTPLTSLPELPASLTELHITDTPLTSLPELPNSLTELNITDVELDSLPELQNSLTHLSITDVELESLPELPASLTDVYIIGTSLTSLPELPHSLTYLSIRGIGLLSLPELPASLTELHIIDTPLTSLPELPNSLMYLYIKNIGLDSLPELPASLTELHVVDTPLTNLPESIARLPATAAVGLHGLSLSHHTIQALNNFTSAPGYAGPRINFSMCDSSVPQETRALHLAVADWLTPASAVEGWKAFERENDAASFSHFLDRLKGTENVRKNSDFKVHISSWLTLLAEDDDLRAKTFAMAHSSTSSCEDRVTLALNHMQTVQLIHRVEKGDFDENYPGLVSVGREMFRLDKLEQIARDKVKTLNFVDEIEVYLGYQNMLRVPLELTTTTTEMRFFGISNINESDLQAAEVQVKADENRQFGKWVLQWQPLYSMLKRKDPASWETLQKKKEQDYKDAYQTLLATELQPARLVGNIDAERTVGAMAMEIAEKKFQKGLESVTKVLLGELLNVKWSTI